MPTPRAHGGAPIAPINLTTPGASGLNSQSEATLLPPQWATLATNCVFDTAGRLALRKGFKTRTTQSVAGVVMRIHEYLKANGVVELILSTDADIFKGAATPASIEGSLGISEGNIKFVNFNDKCIALGTGTSGNPSIYTGSGNFATVSVSSGTAPTAGVGTAAFGRIWCTDTDGATIRYCALLDETKWATADGGGTINMDQVWPNGQDEVIAIEAFAGDLVIFGRKQIVVWTDGQGGDLGLNPLNIYISDTIPNVGAVSQFAITHANGDLWFISPSGLQSLGRAMQNKTTPTTNISKNVQAKFLAYLDGESDEDDLSLVYSPREEFVLACFPASDKVMVFDTRGTLEDGTYRVTEWAVDVQTAVYLRDRSLNVSFTAVAGEILNFQDNQDNGSSYSFAYESGWLDLGQELAQYIKIVKKMTSFVFVGQSTTINFTLKYDFNTKARTYAAFIAGEQGAQFNISEFWSEAKPGYKLPSNQALGVTEFSGGFALRTIHIPGQGAGQYIKVGVSLDNASGPFALQQINLFTKIGRIAT